MISFGNGYSFGLEPFKNSYFCKLKTPSKVKMLGVFNSVC